MNGLQKTILGLALIASFGIYIALATNFESIDVDGTLTVDGASTLTGAVTMGSTLTVGGTLSGITTGIEFEGATADASETTLAATDPTGDRTVTIPDATGTIVLSAGAAQAATAFWGLADSITFEGATADGFEGTISAGDFTADATYTLEAAGGFAISGTRSASLAAAGASYGYDGVMFEGATADDFETILAVTDPTADSTTTIGAAGGWTFPGAIDFQGTATADPGAGIASLGGNGLVFEGATADAFETTIAITDPTADVTWTIGAAGQLTNAVSGQESGWEVLNSGNQACTTTCSGSAALIGFDNGTSFFVAPDDATADTCVCAG